MLRLNRHLVHDGITRRGKYETQRCREVPVHCKQVLHPRAGEDQNVEVAKDLLADALSVAPKRHSTPICAVRHTIKELTKNVNCLIRGEPVTLELFKEEHSSLGEPGWLATMQLTYALNG